MATLSRKMKAHDITYTAVGIALLSVSAWITVPFGPVPFTLQTMALTFLLAVLSPSQGFISVVVYLLLGGVGLPLFSGMRAGVGVLFGPTGGFLMGFVMAAVCCGAVRRCISTETLRNGALVITILGCSYVVGWTWLMYSAALSPAAAFLSGVAPFILPDVIKCCAGIALARAVRRAVPAHI